MLLLWDRFVSLSFWLWESWTLKGITFICWSLCFDLTHCQWMKWLDLCAEDQRRMWCEDEMIPQLQCVTHWAEMKCFVSIHLITRRHSLRPGSHFTSSSPLFSSFLLFSLSQLSESLKVPEWETIKEHRDTGLKRRAVRTLKGCFISLMKPVMIHSSCFHPPAPWQCVSEQQPKQGLKPLTGCHRHGGRMNSNAWT